MKPGGVRKRFIVIVVLAVLAVPAGAFTAADTEGGIGPYPPLSVIYDQIRAIAQAHPDLVKLEVIGKSVEDRPLYALHLGRQDGKTRPEALIFANIHAEEAISSQVALAVAKRLGDDDGKDPWISSLLDQTDFWIIPMLNPDGYQRVISTKGKGGKIGGRRNAHGVDLNRNFPVVPGAKSRHPLAGNHRPNSNYYMGPSPLSEPETRALSDLIKAHHFYVSISGHSVAGKFLYPYCHSKAPAPDRPDFIKVGEALVARQPIWKYQVENSYGWYPTLGDPDDYNYMQNGIMAFTVEHGRVGHNLRYALIHPPLVFWVANPHDLERWIENDRDAILAAVAQALAITHGVPKNPADWRATEKARPGP